MAFLGTTNANNSHRRLKPFTSGVYNQQERANGEYIYPLSIGLEIEDWAALEEQFYQRSNPSHPNYGKYLTASEANALSKPSANAINAIRQWIEPHANARGSFNPTTNVYKVPITVRRLEHLLSTEIHTFVHTDSKHRLLRSSTPLSLPPHLQSMISFLNINTHPLHLRTTATSSVDQIAEGSNTLDGIRNLYDIPDELEVTNASSTQALASFYQENWSSNDMKEFFTEFLPEDSLPRVIAKGNRKNNQNAPTIESSLDMQYLTGIGRNALTYVWTMNGSNPYSVEDEPFLEFAQSVLEAEDPPLVISISYSDDEEHIFQASEEYARSFDALLAKMGLRGISVLVASGDDGVVGLRPSVSKMEDDDVCDRHGPQWPSSSPFITSVGATMQLAPSSFDTNYFSTKDEIVCSSEVGGVITSGGGFSNVYTRPAYQDQVVRRYLHHRSTPQTPGFFNQSGRAYPDVSAVGASFIVYIGGRRTSVSGTSASTPVVAGMVTLWNDMRLNAGKSPLGFLNPLLYSISNVYPDAFNDIVIGNNGAVRGNKKVCNESFAAVPGWDPASGLGSINFTTISHIIERLDADMQLPNTSFVGGVSPKTALGCDDTLRAPKAPTPTTQETRKESDSSTIILVISVIIAILVIEAIVFHWYRKRNSEYDPLDKKPLTSIEMDDRGEIEQGIDTPDVDVTTRNNESVIQ